MAKSGPAPGAKGARGQDSSWVVKTSRIAADERQLQVDDSEQRIPPARLHQFIAAVFEKLGVSAENAALAADSLLIADLRGVTSHGVARLSMYVGQIQTGAIDPRAILTTIRETAATGVYDAANGLALALAPQAMDHCIEKALATGIGMVTVSNSTHFGIAGAYAIQAARRGLGAIAMTNAGPLVTPTGGRTPMLGTNPIAFAVPTGPENPPFVFDMATSAVAYGKIENARRANKPLAPGLALDERGFATTDPHSARSLLPLGGEQATSGYKGYGLAVLVDILCGPLAGALWGTHLASVQRIGNRAGLGHAFMTWRIDAFRDPDDFARELRQLLDELRSCPPAPGFEVTGVLAPGDPELAATRDNEAHGIALHPTVWAEMEAISQQLGIRIEI